MMTVDARPVPELPADSGRSGDAPVDTRADTADAPPRYQHSQKPEHSRKHRRRRLPWWLAVLGWLVVAALAVVAVLRVVAWDVYQPFAVLNDVSLFVYLPAWVVAAVALAWRRPVLGVAALVVVAAQLAFVLPEVTSATAVPAWAATAPSVRMLDANVYAENPSMAGYAAQIRSVRPDLVTLEEATPPDVVQLKRSGALDALPYRYEVKRYDPTAFLVASRYPLTDPLVVYDYGNPLVVELTVGFPWGPKRLWVVHTVAPLPVSFAQWKDQLTVVHALLTGAGPTPAVRAKLAADRGPDGPLVVGDFNATWGSKGFRQILATGLIDAAAVRGRFYQMTWSQTEHPLPPLVRIDHVLTGPRVAVTSIRTDVGSGSDHRDLVYTVAFER